MSDDLIKRSDVYKAVDDWLEGKVPNLNIKDIPSADRPQGKWIMRKPEEEGFGAVFQCPRCSCEVDCVPTNFCPNCGARMKGKDDETD